VGGNTDYPWPFVDTDDFHLPSDSELIDAGQYVADTTDYEGNTVPSGDGTDIGAYEYYSASTEYFGTFSIGVGASHLNFGSGSGSLSIN
jgi:hypothetical protein